MVFAHQLCSLDSDDLPFSLYGSIREDVFFEDRVLVLYFSRICTLLNRHSIFFTLGAFLCLTYFSEAWLFAVIYSDVSNLC